MTNEDVHLQQHTTLIAKNLVKRYPNTLAVDHVSFTIEAGQCFALLGPNGAGKTSTCEMLEGLLEPDEGEISILGMNYQKDRAAILELIGVQLQETHLYKKYTVRETLQLFSSFYRVKSNLDQLLEQLDLTAKTNSRLDQLSGGEKQRVYLGCAFVHNPKLLFLDEPTAGLDPYARRLIWELIEKLKDQNRSFLLTTHHMEEAERLADCIGIIDHGKIVALGSPKELIARYSRGESWKVSFLNDSADTPKHPLLLRELEGTLPWLKEARLTEDGFEIFCENAGPAVQSFIQAIQPFPLKVASLSMRKTTLEDVFLFLTGRKLKSNE